MAGPGLSSSMQAAAANKTLPLFMGIEIDIPETDEFSAATIRLLDGSGSMSWSGMTFAGSDPNFGSWTGVVDPIEDAVGNQAPKFKTGFQGLTLAAIEQICQPDVQGCAVTLYYGYYNLATGQPIPTPVVWFLGALDIGHLTLDENHKSLDIDVVSMAEYMFMNNEGARLNSSYHENFWLGETGFEYVDGVTVQLPWGMNGPRPDQVTGVDNYDYAGLASYSFSSFLG